MKNHRSCYKTYTKFLTIDKIAPPVDTQYSKAFEVFCKDVIEDLIIKQNTIMWMNKVVEMFVKKVCETEHIDISGYRNCLLKRRIQKLFPQVIFMPCITTRLALE